MAKIIIGIHGLNNKPPKPTLETWWKEALIEGLEKNHQIQKPAFDFKLVYWADLIYKYPFHDDANYPLDDLYNHWPYTRLPSGKKPPKYEDTPIDYFREGIRGLFGRGVDKLRQGLGVNLIADKILDKLFDDLASYYDDRANDGDPPAMILNRQQVLEVVKKVLRDELKNVLLEHSTDEIMLIAHSMGSIIAYDVLLDLEENNTQVSNLHLMTIGSPLGLYFVKAEIIRERGEQQLRTPSTVYQWVNYADKRDIVAVDAHLSDDYKPNQNQVRVRDDLVINSYTKPDNKPDYHSEYGYLRTPELSLQVKEFLEG